MGLDVSAYEHATLTPEHEYEDDCYDKGHVHAYLSSPAFVHALGGIEADRCYLVSGEKFDFHAGSYSGYNNFRAALCEAALGVAPSVVWENPGDYTDRRFYHLINFSDCEGTMGPEVCRLLAFEFNEAEDVREKLSNEDGFDWYAQKFDEWKRAFSLASSDGMVSFH